MATRYFEGGTDRRSRSTRGVLKRKREQDDDIESDVSSEDVDPKVSQSTWADLLPEDYQQRKAAGAAVDEVLPGDCFPHRSQDYRPNAEAHISRSEIQKQLAALKPPLNDLPVQAEHAAKYTSIKQQHLEAMHTLLHVSLLNKDYIRASRAFGLLLRANGLEKPPDLRYKNRWGIGAEILLHRKHEQSTDERHSFSFNQEGVEEAKQYYEKLIIQYPYDIRRPNRLSALHFYPILFGLWIAVIDDRYRVALQSIESMNGDGEIDFTFEQLEHLESIRSTVLTDAQGVIQRLEDVMRSIPYSDDPILWQLRGNMHLWLDHLSTKRQRTEWNSSQDQEDRGDEPEMLARRNAQFAFETAARLGGSRKQQQHHISNSDSEAE